MNRKLLALAIGAALAAPLAANAAPTVYGQLNLSADYVDEFNGSPEETFLINSNSSRLGVKGEEKLSSTLNLLYKAEYGVSGDGDAGADWSVRDRYIGLQNKNLGTVRIGAFDSPFKAAEGTVDQFNDLNTLDMGNFISGQDRLSNVIGYTSPKVADALTFAVALQQGEGQGNGHGVGDGISASVAFEQSGMYLAAAINKDVQDGLHDNKATGRNGIRLVGSFQVEAMQLGALLQRTENNDEDAGGKSDEDALILSAGYKMDKANTLKGQVGYGRTDTGAGKDKGWLVAAGMDHSLSQATKVFGQAGYAKVEPAGGAADSKGFTVGVGIATVF